MQECFVDSAGVRLHCVSAGAGPLVILLHGFPDFWRTWRFQLPALAEHFQAVAIDLRGYNRSDQPAGVENYTLDKLIGDVEAVRSHFGAEKAIVAGHDWGGAIAWGYAMALPERTERLIVCNLPHIACINRELAANPKQQAASAYARAFQEPDAARSLTPELLAQWVADPEARAEHIEAMRRSSIEGMLNYYRANYPRPPYQERAYPPVRCPVLMLHGLDDPYLLPGALNDTWQWIESDFTLVTIRGAGHWVHHDAADLVTKRMLQWLRG